MIILGIDPGLARIGWGVVNYAASRFETLAYGCLETKAGQKPETRLCQIYDGVAGIISAWRPQEMAIEELFFTKNITTGIVVAEARGVILLCARQMGLTIAEYTPMQVKQAIAGYGKAEKRQVIAMITSFLGLKAPPKPDDTADALAVAVCHAHTGGSRLSPFYNLR